MADPVTHPHPSISHAITRNSSPLDVLSAGVCVCVCVRACESQELGDSQRFLVTQYEELYRDELCTLHPMSLSCSGTRLYTNHELKCMQTREKRSLQMSEVQYNIGL